MPASAGLGRRVPPASLSGVSALGPCYLLPRRVARFVGWGGGSVLAEALVV